ncbi:MAG: DinB family protein [Deinococcota bacterium]
MTKSEILLPEAIIQQLEQNTHVFKVLTADIPHELIHWKRSPKNWSVLEVLCHLVDEEVEDFRTRVRIALLTPSETPPEIDPEGWVTARKYAQQDFEATVKRFAFE